MKKKTRRKTQADDELMKRIKVVLGFIREPISTRFYRVFEDRLFDSCDYCRQPLLAANNPYLITKHYIAGKLQHEIAICNPCSSELKKGYSEESRKALRNIYNDDYIRSRLNILFSASEHDNLIEMMTSFCSICKINITEVEEHFEYARCEGDEIVFYTHPSAVCSKCTLQIYDSLSAQTKDHKRRFFEQHFGTPPSLGIGKESLTKKAGLWDLL